MKVISESKLLSTTGDNTLIAAFPLSYKGNLTRLTIRNGATSNCVLKFKETFTPDVSGRQAAPAPVTIERLIYKVAAGDSVDIDGKLLAQFLHQLVVNIDQQPVDVGYRVELE